MTFKVGDYIVPIPYVYEWDHREDIKYPYDMRSRVGEVGVVEERFYLRSSKIIVQRVVFIAGGHMWSYCDEWLRLATEDEKRVAHFLRQVKSI